MSKLSARARVLIAVVAPVIILFIHFLLIDILGRQTPYFFAYPISILLAAYLGAVPGLISTIISVIGVETWLVNEPQGVLHNFFLILRPVILISVTLLVGRLGESLRRATARSREKSEQLQRSELEYRAIFDRSSIGKGEIDASTKRLTKVNAKLCEMTGYSEQELLTMNFTDLTYLDDREMTEPAFHKLLMEPDFAYSQEKRYVRKDGSTFWVNVHASVTLTDKDGRPLKVVGSVIDVSARKKAEEMAEAANAAKSAFLANMSHEIRTPLGAVLGFSELLLSADVTEQDRIEFGAAIRRNGDLLSNIINDILDLSKIEAGMLNVERRPAPLSEALTDLSTLLQLRAQEKGLRLQVNVDNASPSSIKTDVLRLRQIILNIVGNAIKFTDKGTVEVTVRNSQMQASDLEILVQDSGVGIEAIHQEKLFQPFYQADTSLRRRFGGTGLGLALSREFARRLGGDVTLVKSNPGEGSTFSIRVQT